ncbi:MAG TPA: hypothetical protein VJG13_08420, partial [Thermoanaerobaculia bacterium]|nr:hypothetical protein [Thermoanaerobaculia bacterium]
MSRRAPRPPLAAVLLALLGACLGVASPAAAQEPREESRQPPPGEPPPGEVTLVLEEGQRPLLRLAFPAIERVGRLSPAGAEAADELEETVRADLEAARIFEIQGPWAFTVLTLTGDEARDMELYRSLGNELLLLGEISEEPGKVTFEGRVFDLVSGQLVLGKRYRGERAVARRIAHTFADEVILYFTGKRGLGLTTIAFHSDRSGDKEIWLMDFDGANERRITAHRSVSLFPAWT